MIFCGLSAFAVNGFPFEKVALLITRRFDRDATAVLTNHPAVIDFAYPLSRLRSSSS